MSAPKKLTAPEKLAACLDIALTSDQPGEIESAMAVARELVRKTGLRVSDFVAAMKERDRAIDLLTKYEARLDALEGEIGQLRARGGNGAGGTLAQALWQDTGMPATPENRHAQWVLSLGIHLTSKETDFLGSCSRRSRLSAAQQDWLRDILRTAIARSGQSPPP